jgi:NAD/NADP transhydrogenase beta subunit
MTETIGNISENFGRELRSFFVLCLLNLVFGALALAFGMQFIVAAVLAMAGAGTPELFPLVQAFTGWAAAVVGFRWILSSAKILKGVTRIRREYWRLEAGRESWSAHMGGESVPGESPGEAIPGDMGERDTSEGPVSGDVLTGLIIRMMAHYRENWKTIWRMNLISILGGAIFLVLGVLNLVQGISALASGSVPASTLIVHAGLISGIGRSVLLSFFAAGLNLAIGFVSLLSSAWFRRYSRAWDLRLIEAEQSGEALRKSMEQR